MSEENDTNTTCCADASSNSVECAAPPSSPVCVSDTPCEDESGTPCEDESKDSSISAPDEAKPPQINLLEVDVTNEQVALNVIIGFLGVAQRRGCFAMNESAKIFECVKKFKTE
jgi:hypothetical protein